MSRTSLAGPSPADSKRISALRIAIFAGALGLALVMLFVVWRSQSIVARGDDPYKFADLGRNLAEGHGFRFTGRPPTIRRAPLYPALIGLLYLAFGVHPLAVQLCQCFFAAGTALLTFEIGRRVFSLRTGLVAAALVAVHPMVLRYVPDMQVETFLQFLYTLTLYRTVRLVEDDRWTNGLWVGLSAAAAALVKGTALPYAALFAVAYLAWRWWSSPQRGLALPGWKPIAAMVLVMAAAILPWAYRNQQITGLPVLISGNASGEFLRGYVFVQPKYFLLRAAPYTDGENEANAMQQELYKENGGAFERDATGLIWPVDEAQIERIQNVAAHEKLHSDPGAFVRKFVIAFFMFWYVVTSRSNSIVVGALALAAWVLATVGFVRGRHSHRHFWLLLTPIVALNVIYAAVLALGRYSAPCIPALMVLCAFGLECLTTRRLADPMTST